MQPISALLPKGQLTCLDELIRKGMYSSRSEAIRMAVTDLVTKELTLQERHNLIGFKPMNPMSRKKGPE